MLAREHELGVQGRRAQPPRNGELVESLPPTWNGDTRWRYNVIFLRHTIDSEYLLKDLGPKPEIEEVLSRPGALLWSAQVTQLTRTTMLKLPGRKYIRYMTVSNLNTRRNSISCCSSGGALMEAARRRGT